MDTRSRRRMPRSTRRNRHWETVDVHHLDGEATNHRTAMLVMDWRLDEHEEQLHALQTRMQNQVELLSPSVLEHHVELLESMLVVKRQNDAAAMAARGADTSTEGEEKQERASEMLDVLDALELLEASEAVAAGAVQGARTTIYELMLRETASLADRVESIAFVTMMIVLAVTLLVVGKFALAVAPTDPLTALFR